MGGTSSSSQISSLELIAKSAPYKDLRSGVELLLSQISTIRDLLDLLNLPDFPDKSANARDALILQTRGLFKQAYSTTYIYKIHCFYQAQRFEQDDCWFFDEAIMCIKTELAKNDQPIRELRTSDPNIKSTKESLGIIITKGEEIVMTVNQGLERMGVSTK